MKLTHTIFLIIATACFAITGCDKKSGGTDSGGGAAPKVVDEKTAIANFKSEMEGVTKWIEEKQKTVGNDPTAGMAMIRDIVGKLKAIKVDGLPDDLKTGYLEFVAAISKMGDIFKDWPAKPEEMQAFIVKKIGEDPKYMEAFGEKMAAIEKEVQPAATKLEEVGKKYGLDMSKVGSSGGGK